MPQHRLGEILGLSAETIKGIEIGRRQHQGLSEELMQKIYVSIGARWASEEREWFPIGSNEPFTLKHYERWKRAGTDRDTETHAMMLRLMLVLDYAPNREFRAIVDTLECKFQEVLRDFEYQPDNHDVDWLNTRLWITPDSKGRYRRSRPVWTVEKGSLFDFRHRLDFVTPRNRTETQAEKF